MTRYFRDEPNWIEPTHIELPEGKPSIEASANRETVARAGVAHAFLSDLMKYWYYGLLGPLWAVSIAGILAVGSDLWWMAEVMAITTVVLVVAFVPVKTAEYVAEYDHMMYRMYDDEIAGYDELLAEVQWRLGFRDVANISVQQGRIDRRLGTQTIELEAKDGRQIRLANLPEGHAIHKELECRI
ncbi:PH domain-containing protein [Haladaptatus litoreus]|uniref:PH domain-containing protein n=1 Tax=Haladaptatus litoreus TaxID=553468 RepID=UPI00097140AB|nr:PH domain-containing protein [Haladaptatus litoreus]